MRKFRVFCSCFFERKELQFAHDLIKQKDNIFDNWNTNTTMTMGITKKDVQDIKDNFAGAKRLQLHSTVHNLQVKKEVRHNLQRKIVRMFSTDRYTYKTNIYFYSNSI